MSPALHQDPARSSHERKRPWRAHVRDLVCALDLMSILLLGVSAACNLNICHFDQEFLPVLVVD